MIAGSMRSISTAMTTPAEQGGLPTGAFVGTWDAKREMVLAPKSVATGPGTFTHPEISRDGTRLALWGLAGDQAMVRCMDLAANKEFWQSSPDFICCHPTWSPDGTQLAFACNPNCPRDNIPGALYDTSRFSPRQIWVANLRTGKYRQVTANGADNERPAWSPDGTRLAFVSTHNGQTAIRVAAAANRQEQPVTDCNGRSCYRPAWHPDGERIIFNTKGPDNHYLWIVHHNGSGLGQLTPNATGPTRIWDHGACCSADGSQVLFHSNRGGAPGLWLLDIESKNLREVQVEGFDWAAHGTWDAAQTRIAFDAPLRSRVSRFRVE